MTLQSSVPLPNQVLLKRMWNYYKLSVNSPYYGLNVTLDEKSVGDADLFLKKGELPTRSNFDYRDNSQNSVFSLLAYNQTQSIDWYIGVYGFTDVAYTIIATVTTSCLNDCSNHGTCSSGVCTCSVGWIGNDCSKRKIFFIFFILF